VTCMYLVRRLRVDEWQAYRDIRLRALRDSPSAFGSMFEVESVKADVYWKARLASGLASPHQFPLVAEHDSRIVGLVWGWIDPERTDAAHVIQMWVAPEARGQGCGARLMESIIEWARQAAVQSVHLSVTCGDTAAQRLYRRLGFQPSGEPEPLRPGSVELAQPMQLKLDSHAA
jgi:ribosomal protein S18 acetylase RimI-like enzyme